MQKETFFFWFSISLKKEPVKTFISLSSFFFFFYLFPFPVSLGWWSLALVVVVHISPKKELKKGRQISYKKKIITIPAFAFLFFAYQPLYSPRTSHPLSHTLFFFRLRCALFPSSLCHTHYSSLLVR
ncbi:hypothetical protein F4810DRAFT_635579 [Camillea tinctor]|nr:hypothetical protein F4810DRAFT_635579 [Camillea tinctor]